MCIDDALQREMMSMGAGMSREMCTRNEFKRDGARYVGNAECRIGESKIVSRSVMTLTGDSAYHTEINATYEPPFMGMKDSQTMLDGKYVGPCRDGLAPGDFIGPNGQKFNIRGHGVAGKPPAAPPSPTPAPRPKAPAMSHNLFDTLQQFKLASGATGRFYSLPALERAGVGKVSRLPVSIRIVLESVLRNCDGKKVTEAHVRELAELEGQPPSASTRSRSSSRASCCRTSPACRCWPTWRRCATSPATSARTRRRSSRWCRSTSSSTTR